MITNLNYEIKHWPESKNRHPSMVLEVPDTFIHTQPAKLIAAGDINVDQVKSMLDDDHDVTQMHFGTILGIT